MLRFYSLAIVVAAALTQPALCSESCRQANRSDRVQNGQVQACQAKRGNSLRTTVASKPPAKTKATTATNVAKKSTPILNPAALQRRIASLQSQNRKLAQNNEQLQEVVKLLRQQFVSLEQNVRKLQSTSIGARK